MWYERKLITKGKGPIEIDIRFYELHRVEKFFEKKINAKMTEIGLGDCPSPRRYLKEARDYNLWGVHDENFPPKRIFAQRNRF